MPMLMDIEDGVAPAAKDTARKQIAASLDQVVARKKEDPSFRTPARFVRINAVGHERMHADLEQVIRPGLEGLAVPKTETVEEVKIVERILDEREPKMGIPSGSVRFAYRSRKSERVDECLCNRHFVATRHRTAIWRRGFFARTEPAVAARGRGDGFDLCTFFSRRCSRCRSRAIGGRCVAEFSRHRRSSESLRYRPGA